VGALRVTGAGKITRGLVVLFCERDHDHVMAPEQAARIQHERCPWCRTAYVRASLHAVSPWDREAVAALLGPLLFIEPAEPAEVLA
jgi:hypothetical protein